MNCRKCNRKLPEDSEFCQYCGIKLKNKIEEINSGSKKTIYVNVRSKESVGRMMGEYVDAATEAVMANLHSQPQNEDDEDFGLVPEKPIFTSGDKLVAGEKEYLNRLYTIDGDKMQYIRRGSINADGINGIIDVYDTFLPSGQPYKTLYINMYGAKASTKAPAGFVLIKEDVIAKKKKRVKPIKKRYCSHCGTLIDGETKMCAGCGRRILIGKKFTRFSVLLIVFLFLVGALSIFCGFQHINIRNLKNVVGDLKRDVDIKSSAINKLEKQIDTQKNTIGSLEKQVDSLEDQKEELTDNYIEDKIKLYFYDKHAVVVNENSKKYHKYECDDLDFSYFWIYNTELAESKGYYACPKCH